MSETALETLTRERNLYKGKYRALLKLIKHTRDKIVQITDHIEDEGDRAYFGSTNDADDLKEIYRDMMSWIWDAVDKTNRMQSDPYADIRKQRARAEKAEAALKLVAEYDDLLRNFAGPVDETLFAGMAPVVDAAYDHMVEAVRAALQTEGK